jgi:hypothetical protein
LQWLTQRKRFCKPRQFYPAMWEASGYWFCYCESGVKQLQSHQQDWAARHSVWRFVLPRPEFAHLLLWILFNSPKLRWAEFGWRVPTIKITILSRSLATKNLVFRDKGQTQGWICPEVTRRKGDGEDLLQDVCFCLTDYLTHEKAKHAGIEIGEKCHQTKHKEQDGWTVMQWKKKSCTEPVVCKKCGH